MIKSIPAIAAVINILISQGDLATRVIVSQPSTMMSTD